MSQFLNYEPCPKCQAKGNDTRGDNCAVYSDGGKHCFSCGFHVFPKHYSPRVQEKKKLNAAVLPTDFSREIPSHALKWLLQYELPYSYWRPFIGWSEKDMRLVFTIGDGPSFSIGRYIPEEGRSLPRAPRKWFVWGESHRHPHIFGDYSKASKIVLVEDVISAHKLSFVSPTICLFGTTIFNSCIPVLRYVGLPIVLWLDKDQEQSMPKKCEHLRFLTGLDVSYITTNNDPKEQPLSKIQELLTQAQSPIQMFQMAK